MKILNAIKMMIKSNGNQLASEKAITITTSALTNQGIDDLKSVIHNWVGKNGKRLS